MIHMWAYIITLLVYLASYPAVFALTGNMELSLAAKIVLTLVALLYCRKSFRFKFRVDLFSVVMGLLVAFIWVALEGTYPLMSRVDVVAYEPISIVMKLFAGIFLASMVEEFFTRYFLARFLIDNSWQKVPLGKFTTMSFIITVLYFGFSHNRWLAGLIAGAIFNYVIFRKKRISSAVVAHAVANLALGVYVIYTGSWQFW